MRTLNALIYLGDGRLHLESITIHNPYLPALQCDHDDEKLTREKYDYEDMHSLRKHAIDIANKGPNDLGYFWNDREAGHA